MTLDMLSGILKNAENPELLSKELAEKLRELTGAKLVVIVKSQDPFRESSHAIVGFIPERRESTARSKNLISLVNMTQELFKSTLYELDKAKSPIAKHLKSLESALTIITPLFVGKSRIGSVLLLDLPDKHAINQVVEMLDMLSTVVALIFRSAFMYQNQEIIIEERTNELRKSEENFHRIIQDLMEGFYSATLEGKLILYNMEFVRLLGLDPKNNYKGMELPGFWQYQEERSAYIDELTKEGYVANYMVKAKKSDGEKIILQANSRLIFNNDNIPVRIEGTFMDITDRKLVEEELKIHREHLEELVTERTKELEERNAYLDRAMKVFVGREMTIRDLQRRIKAFEGKGTT